MFGVVVFSLVCLQFIYIFIFECEHIYSFLIRILECVCVHTCTRETMKIPQTVVSAYGRSQPHIGPSRQIEKNEIFCNLNVNGSGIYRWVLCNYQCHNLLELCLCGEQERENI